MHRVVLLRVTERLASVCRPLTHLGERAADVLRPRFVVRERLREVTRPVTSAAGRTLEVARPILLAAAPALGAVGRLLALAAIYLSIGLKVGARAAARLPVHRPRSDLEIAALAGSASIGLLIGATFYARSLDAAEAPAPRRVAAAEMIAPTPVPTAAEAPPRPLPDIKPRVLPKLKIPQLNIDAPMQPVGLTADGAMDAPTDGQSVAWYSLGPFPGSAGNAILAGHVDWGQRAAVFRELKNLAPGASLYLDFDRGADLQYQVTWVEQYRAQAAPLNKVFDNMVGSALTLITCGGPFDNRTRTYQDRIVVRAIRV